MKKSANLFVSICVVSLLTIMLISCGSDDGPTSSPPPSPPSITNVQPDSGQVGEEITISGNNFSTTKAENKVLFNGKEAEVTSASESELKVTVPEDASTGPLKVVVDGSPTSEMNFKILASGVTITNIDPKSGPIGSSVTISGRNFSARASEDSVTFNDTVATLTRASETQIVASVPEGATTGAVRVYTSDGIAYGPDFTVTYPTPTISSITPESGSIGSEVTINGSHFSSTSAKDTVTFNGIRAEVTSASLTELKVNVPAEATTGPVKVKVHGKTSEGTNFEVTYPAPTISNITPQEGPVGTEITIEGKNFSKTASENTVTINGTEATITSASETELDATVSDGTTSGLVKVTVHNQTATGGTFTIKIPETLSIVNFDGERKDFDGITAVKFIWTLKNPNNKDLTCTLDTDGDGKSDYTINSCPESGTQLWLYRQQLSANDVTPELSVTSGDESSNTSQSFDAAVEISAKRIADISGNAFQALALSDMKNVTAWGDNSDKTNVPDKVQGKAIGITTSKTDSYVLMDDHTIVGFGENGAGQLDIPDAVQDHAVQVSAGQDFTIALLDDGTVAAWGTNGSGQTAVPQKLTNVVAIASGRFNSLALKADGTIISWGDNKFDQAMPPSELTDEGHVVSISESIRSSEALKFDGTITSWGRDVVGADTPPADLGPVIVIAAGGFHQMALQADGLIREWGKNSWNNFNGSLDKPGIPDVIDIATDFQYGLAIKSDGTVVGWGQGNSNQANTIPNGLDLIH